MRSELLYCALLELLEANLKTEVLEKRASEEQNRNEQIEIEEERENVFVVKNQNVVRLR